MENLGTKRNPIDAVFDMIKYQFWLVQSSHHLIIRAVVLWQTENTLNRTNPTIN